jgi:hypothetical protein
MEENLEPEEEREHEELHIDTNNPLFVFCFMFMEYIKEIDPELYTKAHKYAHDHTDLDITDFEIGEFEEIEEDEDLDDEESEYESNYDDDEFEANN